MTDPALPPFAREAGPPLPPGQKRAIPRPAASLILIRRPMRGPTEVLLGRRAGKHRFLPNIYAFPGGRVDLEDKLISDIKYMNYNVINYVIKSKCDVRMATALGVAALRETYEETGLAIGEMAGGAFRPDLSRLLYLGRAITPSESPIRFHARFFLADAEAASGAMGGSGELLDLAFRPLDEALRLPLADITEFWLQHLAKLSDLTTQPDKVVFWRYRRGRPLIGQE